MLSLIAFSIGWFIVGGAVLGMISALDGSSAGIENEFGLSISIVSFWPVVLLGLLAYLGFLIGRRVAGTIVKVVK